MKKSPDAESDDGGGWGNHKVKYLQSFADAEVEICAVVLNIQNISMLYTIKAFIISQFYFYTDYLKKAAYSIP